MLTPSTRQKRIFVAGAAVHTHAVGPAIPDYPPWFSGAMWESTAKSPFSTPLARESLNSAHRRLWSSRPLHQVNLVVSPRVCGRIPGSRTGRRNRVPGRSGCSAPHDRSCGAVLRALPWLAAGSPGRIRDGSPAPGETRCKHIHPRSTRTGRRASPRRRRGLQCTAARICVASRRDIEGVDFCIQALPQAIVDIAHHQCDLTHHPSPPSRPACQFTRPGRPVPVGLPRSPASTIAPNASPRNHRSEGSMQIPAPQND